MCYFTASSQRFFRIYQTSESFDIEFLQKATGLETYILVNRHTMGSKNLLNI